MRIFNELVGVAVARHDDHVVAGGGRLGRQRREDVVGLEARRFDYWDLHRVDELANEAHLLAQDIGSLRSGGFVARDHLVAEGGLRPVEGHDQLVRVVFLDEVHEHGREAVDRVGHLPRGRGHRGREGKKSAISKGVPVKQHQQGHCLTPLWELGEYCHRPPARPHLESLPPPGGHPAGQWPSSMIST